MLPADVDDAGKLGEDPRAHRGGGAETELAQDHPVSRGALGVVVGASGGARFFCPAYRHRHNEAARAMPPPLAQNSTSDPGVGPLPWAMASSSAIGMQAEPV